MQNIPQNLPDFLIEYINKDVTQLALTQKFPLEWLQQLSARQKAIEKLPTWAKNPHIKYQKLALEQCSSEITASYKAFLLQNCIFPRNKANETNQNSEKMADLTGGFGVDTYFFAQYFDKVFHVEMQTELQSIVKENFEQLGIKNNKNIDFFEGKDTDFLDFFQKNYLKNSEKMLYCLYLDPHRREGNQKSNTGQKVFKLEDCQPNILGNLEEYFKVSEIILVKVAPFLDILQGLKLLKYVFQCYIVSVDKELKEILYFLKKPNKENTENNGFLPENVPIFVVDLDKNELLKENFVFQFTISEENQTKIPNFSLPKKYLYEPHACMMKAGAFKAFAERYNLEKLHQNTHLYTSDFLLLGIPAKVFEVIETLPYQKKAVQDFLQGEKVEITVRNLKENPQEVQKKLGIVKTGGKKQLFACTNLHNKPQILVCERV